MIPTEIQPEAPTEIEILEPYQTEHEISILDGLILLLQRKGFIIRFVVGATVIAVIVSLLLPVKYEAKVVLLPPAQNASLASSLMGEIGAMGSLGSLAALAGGGLNI